MIRPPRAVSAPLPEIVPSIQVIGPVTVRSPDPVSSPPPIVNWPEVAVLVSDQWQGKGLGKGMMARMLLVAAGEKLSRVIADILPDNRDIMRICEKLGFSLKHSVEDQVVTAEFSL